jgi:hypothetical protein
MVEAVEMAYQTGETPALAFLDDDGKKFLVMRLEDAGEVFTSEAQAFRTPRRSEIVRSLSRVPAFLRDTD